MREKYIGTIQDYCFVCAVEEHIRTALKGSPYALQPRVFVGKLKSKLLFYYQNSIQCSKSLS